MQAPEQMPFAMANTCPACAAPLPVRRVRVLRTRSNRSTWFKFAADRYFCPSCEVELQRQQWPLGILLLCGAVLAMVVAFVAMVSLSPAGPLHGLAPLIAVLASVPLVACYARWGFAWTTAK